MAGGYGSLQPGQKDEIIALHQKMYGGRIVEGAKRLQPLLEASVRRVSYVIIGARLLTPPDKDKHGNAKLKIKDPLGALEKVNREYAGSWVDMKDMARCTLVVEREGQVLHAMALLKTYFRAGNPTGIVYTEDKIVDGRTNKAGYSGWTVVVSMEGHKGEIQVNTPEMMYAKSLPEFCAAFPGRDEDMAKKFPAVPGGIGHKLYDVSRDDKQPKQLRDAYNKASKMYYDYFRGNPPNFIQGRMARYELAKLGLVDEVGVNTQPVRVSDEIAKLPKLVNVNSQKPKPAPWAARS